MTSKRKAEPEKKKPAKPTKEEKAAAKARKAEATSKASDAVAELIALFPEISSTERKRFVKKILTAALKSDKAAGAEGTRTTMEDLLNVYGD